MAYRFKLKESLRQGCRRIACEQIDLVKSGPRPDLAREVWVHETRRTMKRTRALLKLVRSGCRPEDYKRENAALQAIARSLSGMRDRDVIHQTMSGLSGTGGRKLDAALAWLAAVLSSDDDGSSGGDTPAATDPAEAIEGVITALAEARERLSNIEVEGDVAEVLAAGLADCQRRGRKALARLEADNRSDEALHDLRKAVQTYQRQQALVSPVWPALQEVRVKAARDLARLLGSVQDLAVLAAEAARRADGAEGRPDASARIAKACRKRQDDLEAIALPVARRLFAPSPKSVAAELACGWAAAIALAKAGPIDGAAAAAGLQGEELVSAD
ncbi:MAG: CHAD domain-containing protein [Hyphomicrobiaceae bacterium]